ncbi:hypothetical protein ACFQX9_35210 [Bradyrhizobium sp. GCM10028915]|uniref:amino acid kinase family protein n=1 Tax=Bradyrhizobium TaxID=374 RepID=UPI001FD985C5|nr:hypothetical protein [Bradyrhizobium canariense]
MLLTTGERISMSPRSAFRSRARHQLHRQPGRRNDRRLTLLGAHSGCAAHWVMRGTRSRTRRGAGKISGRERGDQEITTLGRGGSDTTAVAMAAALKAERREIIKEVDGICSADPRIVPDAKSLRRVDFAFLSEMCS